MRIPEAIAATLWDVAIVGGGSAGAILAHRLSEDPARKVLLIEAGRDMPPGTESDAILDMYPGRAAFDPANHWPDLPAEFRPFRDNAPPATRFRQYEQARIIGGGSSINGQVANRGTPEDYDEWAALGATGWRWDDVLPFFIRVERDLDFGGPLHGKDGRIPIHRIPRDAWPGFSHAAAAALEHAGYRDIRDQNGVFDEGWFAQTLSNDGKHRVSTAIGYLDAATRARRNLAILTRCEVTTLRLEGRRAIGLDVLHGGAIAAREIIVSAGAINSPALLMRSGIGPAAELRAVGVEVAHDLPGVGRNVQEHPGISIAAFVNPAARLGDTTRRHIHLAMRYGSGIEGAPRADMYLMVVARSAWHALGQRIGGLLSWINKPVSRGEVRLRDPDPRIGPMARFNYLADPRDIQRLVKAFRFMATLFTAPALAAVSEHASPAVYTALAKRFGRPGFSRFALTFAVGLAIDASPALRRKFFAELVAAGRPLAALLADDTALEDYVRDHAFGQWHPCGTCRMGPSSDRQSVIDPITARIHGLDGIRIIDASVMPTIPRANLNLPTMMIAEKFAAGVG